MKSPRQLKILVFKHPVVHTGIQGPSYKVFKREMDRRFQQLYGEKLRKHPMHPDNSDISNDNQRIRLNRELSQDLLFRGDLEAIDVSMLS